MHLILLETSGNQSFIFATNKLRENVGASELTARVGTKFVLEAVASVGGPNLARDSMAEVRQALRDPSLNQPIDSMNLVEVILAASGKALLLVRDETVARSIVCEVTRRALKEAPGLEVRGVVSRDFDFETTPLHLRIGEVHRQFEVVRSRLPGPAARFQRLPIIAECASSGLPAERYTGQWDRLPPGEQGPRSAQSLAKLAARDGWRGRLQGILQANHSNVTLPYSTTEIETLDCDWLAIVHADGNGLGQVFLNFHTVAHAIGNRDYVQKLRSFSLALDECTETAFCRSLAVFRPRHNIAPIVPLVLGGDDLTVVCDGRQALQFTKKFIDCFEEETSKHPAINSILKNGVTSCAGVAIVKPHFPFFAGYQLAEELLKSAKKLAKRNPENLLSAIDYHILYDASGPDLDRIRQELTVDDGKSLLVGRPYVATEGQGPVNRRWSDLVARIAAVRARDEDEDRRRLPNSMLHELREGLYLGQDAAEARLALVRNRYRPHINPLLFWDNLFWPEGDQHLTGLLDAIDTADFWQANVEAQP